MNANETKVGAMTPPPWEAQDQLGKLCVFGPEGECIAVCNSSIAPNEANARAIAALPDVLKALRRMLVTNGGPIDHADTIDGRAYVMVEMDAFEQARTALQKAGCL